MDRAYKTNNSLLSFKKDVKKLTHIFKRNQFHEQLVKRVVKTYLDNSNNSASSGDNDALYFKLPYLPFSKFARRKLRTDIAIILISNKYSLPLR